jgi:glycosyltransferase involved in cell wall biosynthesis
MVAKNRANGRNPPIIIFAYNRVLHLQKTIESLLRNPEASLADLIVYVDAARSKEDEVKVEEVIFFLKTVTGFGSITVIHRPQNFGLAKSIIEGVSEVLYLNDSVIVLEDDMVTSPYFLSYMNESLERFANDERVISVHGYIYPVQEALPEAFFLRGADCWGWATWRRGWALFNPDGAAMLSELNKHGLVNSFNYNGAYDYYQMLKDQIDGKNNSWAVRWHAAAFLANKLTLYPGRSLVHNIGNDSSGTHCVTTDVLDVELSSTPIRLNDVRVEESLVVKKTIEKFFKSKKSIFKRLFVFLRRHL